MASQFFIPVEVIRDIHDWTRRAELAAIADFPQTSADEDSIVESFGTRLRCSKRLVNVAMQREVPGPWTWSVSHTRFQGRGRGAAEKHVGADVVIELTVRWGGGSRVDTKTLLLQAKKEWKNDPTIIEQVARLSTWREAAAVINLTGSRFEAFRLDDVIQAQGRRPTNRARRLSEFFTKEFVSGELGDDTLLYDARRKLLSWLDMKDVYVMCSFHCRHRIVINITPPAPLGPLRNAAQIEPEEIHEHRLKASPAQILDVSQSPSNNELRVALRRLQKIYHPDKHAPTANLVRQAMNRRSQEINHAFDILSEDS